MSDTSKLSTCQIISWGLALLFGVLVLWTTSGAVGFFAALLLGLAFAVFLGLVVTSLVCTGSRVEDCGIVVHDVEEEAPAPSAAVVTEAKAETVSEGDDAGRQPVSLAGPRGGTADDLKLIKGVGPKLEELCHAMGFYHFDQIAGWSKQEIAWVDANLKGFKGRVSRDNWVEQAKTLAMGGETEFSKRAAAGGVYEV
ncbi:NADH:ubiquinone oxidoreductase [Roseovarius sp.]|uniref:NADH:ubiquinone oxidoreductase n=1 Tax=Roseovarius sp. TaxID=1486281 RepID=UPI003A97FFB9